jgi:hypothetical protein
MKNLKRLSGAVVLSLTLAFSTFAGDILGPGIVAQPPQPSSTTSQMNTPSTTGEVPTPGAVSIAPLTELTLCLFQGMRFIF